MRADDEGFVNNPKKVMRMIGASQDELNVLLTKRFVLGFDSGVIVIKHWRMHNYIQKDRFTPTVYHDERSQIKMKENKAYTYVKNMDTKCIQDDNTGKDSIGKDSIEEERGNFDISSLPTEDKMSKKDIQVFKKYLYERGKKDFPPRFAAVHAKWPKKDDKKASAQAWLETLKTDSIDDMEKAVDNYLQANKDTDPQYIKGLKTFFGPSEPWRDYVKMSFTKSQSHDNINLIANKLKEDV